MIHDLSKTNKNRSNVVPFSDKYHLNIYDISKIQFKDDKTELF